MGIQTLVGAFHMDDGNAFCMVDQTLVGAFHMEDDTFLLLRAFF